MADNIQVFNNSGGTKNIFAGGGEDIVYSANGIAGDQIDCGNGDTVRKDAGDTHSNCENLEQR